MALSEFSEVCALRALLGLGPNPAPLTSRGEEGCSTAPPVSETCLRGPSLLPQKQKEKPPVGASRGPGGQD